MVRRNINTEHKQYDTDISIESLELNSFSDTDSVLHYIAGRNQNYEPLDTPSTSQIYSGKRLKNIEYGKLPLDKNENYYTPLAIRGKGADREGMCQICRCYFKLKTSNYWYHMNFTHGINSKGAPYPKPEILNDSSGYYVFCEACNSEYRIGKKKTSSSLSTFYKHYHEKHR